MRRVIVLLAAMATYDLNNQSMEQLSGIGIQNPTTAGLQQKTWRFTVST